MIVVTGAAGFIGSCLVSRLNKAGYDNIVVVDDFSKTEKAKNLEGKTISSKVGRKDFIKWLGDFGQEVVQYSTGLCQFSCNLWFG